MYTCVLQSVSTSSVAFDGLPPSSLWYSVLQSRSNSHALQSEIVSIKRQRRLVCAILHDLPSCLRVYFCSIVSHYLKFTHTHTHTHTHTYTHTHTNTYTPTLSFFLSRILLFLSLHRGRLEESQCHARRTHSISPVVWNHCSRSPGMHRTCASRAQPCDCLCVNVRERERESD
jgi:hypothetical protein